MNYLKIESPLGTYQQEIPEDRSARLSEASQKKVRSTPWPGLRIWTAKGEWVEPEVK